MANRYYGIYGAWVERNDVGEGVLSVTIPTVFPGGESVPALPSLPYGVLFLPEKDDKVWVQFEGGEPTRPLWTGVQPGVSRRERAHPQGEPALPERTGARQAGGAWPADPGPPAARMLRSLKDHRLTLDDGTPAVEMRFGGKKHAISLTGSAVTVTHDAGHAVTLEQGRVSIAFAAGGPTVELEQGAVTISLGGSSVKLDPVSVTVSGPLVKLGAQASKPVIHAADFGVGNLGAPVVITPTQFSVLA